MKFQIRSHQRRVFAQLRRASLSRRESSAVMAQRCVTLYITTTATIFSRHDHATRDKNERTLLRFMSPVKMMKVIDLFLLVMLGGCMGRSAGGDVSYSSLIFFLSQGDVSSLKSGSCMPRSIYDVSSLKTKKKRIFKVRKINTVWWRVRKMVVVVGLVGRSCSSGRKINNVLGKEKSNWCVSLSLSWRRMGCCLGK